jgi:hypothetical protein
VIAAERKIERDLADLIDTFKESGQSSGRNGKTSPRQAAKNDRNKLLAELKAVRLLQVRINEETKDLDDHRVAIKGLPKALQDQILDNRDHQAIVRDTLDRLNAVVSGKPQTY